MPRKTEYPGPRLIETAKARAGTTAPYARSPMPTAMQLKEANDRARNVHLLPPASQHAMSPVPKEC